MPNALPVSIVAIPLPAGAATEATLARVQTNTSLNAGKAVLRFVVNQGAAGNTVIAAASPGNKHKVIGFMLTLSGNGTLTWFSDGVAMTGPLVIEANQNPPVLLPPNPKAPLLETTAGQSLNFTTTGGALKGVILYLTEP